MPDRTLKRGLRIIFEIIRTGRPPRRTRLQITFWRLLVALVGLAVAALLRLAAG